MYLALIYPPFGTPTSPPVGLSYLSAYLKEHSNHRIKSFDLNLRYYKAYLKQSEQALLHSPKFYNEEGYIACWNSIIDRMNHLEKTIEPLCKSYLETDDSTLLQYIEPLVQDILNEKPDIIGISINHHHYSSSTQLFYALALAKYLKKTLTTKIIIGGAVTSVLDISHLLKLFPFIDHCILGEGEIPSLSLLNCYESGDIPEQILYCKDKVKISKPDYSGFALDNYLSEKPVATIQFKRGCTWNKCTFCTQNIPYSMKNQVEDIPTFVKTIKELQSEYNIHHFYFSDQEFTAPIIEGIADTLIDQNISIHYHIMASPKKSFTYPLLKKLKQSGCEFITWGVESGSDRILKLMNKGTNTHDIKEVITASHLAGITNAVLMMYGFPTETKEETRQSIELLETLSPYYYDSSISPFALEKGSYIFNHPNEFDITIKKPQIITTVKGNPIYSYIYDFEKKTGISTEEAVSLIEPSSLSNRTKVYFAEHLLLYKSN